LVEMPEGEIQACVPWGAFFDHGKRKFGKKTKGGNRGGKNVGPKKEAIREQLFLVLFRGWRREGPLARSWARKRRGANPVRMARGEKRILFM